MIVTQLKAFSLAAHSKCGNNVYICQNDLWKDKILYYSISLTFVPFYEVYSKNAG